MEQSHCKTCGEKLSGKYCSHCGEKVLTPKDKSIQNWFHELFANLSMLDGKVISTIRELFFSPHVYASNFAEGKRVSYIRPLNLFLLINLIYFVFSSFNTFKTNLYIQMNGLPYSSIVSEIVEEELIREWSGIEEYREAYDQKTNEISKMILIILAPMLGCVFYILFRKKGMYLSDGFNLALQFWTFFILFFLILVPPILQFIVSLIPALEFDGEVFTSFLILTGSAIYVGYLLSHWKGSSKLAYGIKILLITLSFYPILILYRGILFLLTFWLL